ncbi:cytochrome o ubiquinol oxidase subunit III [Buchnera aphidicola]|uniref:cytochrome o ubiquinol oxidase subunit III n=1 Tax=Buchnera aphidicola TaxID=9 RepID=UPI0031B69A27
MIFKKENSQNKFIKITSKKNINFEKKIFGFWLYLMSECIVFSVLFVVFFLMNTKNQCFNMMKTHEISFQIIFLETIFLLLSSFIYSIIVYFFKRISIRNIFFILCLTLFFTSLFLILEIYELNHIFLVFCPYEINGFFSSFFALLGMHCIHIFGAIFWILLLIFRIFFNENIKNLYSDFFCLNLFFQFLDIIWLFIIIFVYLLHKIS